MKLTDEQVAHVKMLEDDRGVLTPDAVVADARRKDSPLHSLFDWDRSRAAESWFRECAREIIRVVKIVLTDEVTTISAHYYVRDPEAGKEQGYRSVVALRREPTLAREALIEELRRASGAMTRARMVGEALGLADEIDAMLVTIHGLQHLVESSEPVAEAMHS